MIINNIAHYQSSNLKPKSGPKAAVNTAFKAAPVDTYEPSGSERERATKASPPKDVRSDLIKTVKGRIQSGFYDSKDVLEDLSNSFAKALHQTLG